MHETPAELDALDDLLTRSLGGSSPHLRSIIRPGRTLDARQLTAVLTGMRTITVATVTARGEPRISALDGHLLHGRWVFGTDRHSPKARQMLVRPAISVAYVRGEDIGVFAHGTAEPLFRGDPDEHPEWPEIHAYLQGHYGESPLGWGEVAYVRLQPHWMVAYSGDVDRVVAGLTPPAGG